MSDMINNGCSSKDCGTHEDYTDHRDDNSVEDDQPGLDMVARHLGIREQISIRTRLRNHKLLTDEEVSKLSDSDAVWYFNELDNVPCASAAASSDARTPAPPASSSSSSYVVPARGGSGQGAKRSEQERKELAAAGRNRHPGKKTSPSRNSPPPASSSLGASSSSSSASGVKRKRGDDSVSTTTAGKVLFFSKRDQAIPDNAFEFNELVKEHKALKDMSLTTQEAFEKELKMAEKMSYYTKKPKRKGRAGAGAGAGAGAHAQAEEEDEAEDEDEDEDDDEDHAGAGAGAGDGAGAGGAGAVHPPVYFLFYVERKNNGELKNAMRPTRYWSGRWPSPRSIRSLLSMPSFGALVILPRLYPGEEHKFSDEPDVEPGPVIDLVAE